MESRAAFSTMTACFHRSVSRYRTMAFATCPREGQKVFTLQTLPAEPEARRREVAESSGYLHAAPLEQSAAHRAGSSVRGTLPTPH
jgi:hypothetical protein